MPIYEYVCDDCATRYEKLVRSNGEAIACPKCGSKEATLQFSTFSTATSGKDSSSTDTGSFSGGACGCTPRGCGCH